jgi:uncharacterized protein (TIRG00374 family)
MNKKRISIAIGLIISVIAAVVIVRQVDLTVVWKNVIGLSSTTLIVLLLIYLVNMLARAIRWKLIIKHRYNEKVSRVFDALSYGYMLNQILPAKIGEVARAEYLCRKSKNSRSYILGTIAVERVFDLIVIVMFLGVSVLFSETIQDIFNSKWISIILIIAGLFGVIVFLRNLYLLKKITVIFPEKVRTFFDRIVDNIAQSFKVFDSFKQVLIILGMSFGIWLLTSLMFFLIIKEIGIDVPGYAYFFIVSAGTFGMIIPSTSANVGVYHAVAMGALLVFMVPKEQALSFAIIAHAFDFFPALLLGGTVYLKNRLIRKK